jgi:hypothetical protein
MTLLFLNQFLPKLSLIFSNVQTPAKELRPLAGVDSEEFVPVGGEGWGL